MKNIFKSYKASGTILALLVIIMCSLTLVLITEYQSLRKQMRHVVSLKEEYRNYILAVKQVLSEQNKKSLETTIECDSRIQKKNAIGEVVFPDGVRVFSSDDEPSEEESGSFTVINRDLEYLKQSSLEFIQDQDLNLLRKVDPQLWQGYTNQVIASRKAQSARKPQKKQRRKKVARSVRRPSKKEYVAPAPLVKDIELSWPINRDNFWLSSKFGPRKKPNGKPGFHYGIDMAAIRGTPVKAAAAGVVIEAGSRYGYGNTIVVVHNNKYKTRYAHLDSISVKVGQKVHRGMMIGKVGDTGYVRSKGKDASHLHFEVHAFGKQVNPMYFL